MMAATICWMVSTACAATTAVDRITFEAESPVFSKAVADYKAIWAADGARIVGLMEQKTGLRVEPNPILAIVHEGVSSSGYHDIPMRLRASYPFDIKRATLVHELSHRLISDLVPKRFEEHARQLG